MCARRAQDTPQLPPGPSTLPTTMWGLDVLDSPVAKASGTYTYAYGGVGVTVYVLGAVSAHCVHPCTAGLLCLTITCCLKNTAAGLSVHLLA